MYPWTHIYKKPENDTEGGFATFPKKGRGNKIYDHCSIRPNSLTSCGGSMPNMEEINSAVEKIEKIWPEKGKKVEHEYEICDTPKNEVNVVPAVAEGTPIDEPMEMQVVEDNLTLEPTTQVNSTQEASKLANQDDMITEANQKI